MEERMRNKYKKEWMEERVRNKDAKISGWRKGEKSHLNAVEYWLFRLRLIEERGDGSCTTTHRNVNLQTPETLHSVKLKETLH